MTKKIIISALIGLTFQQSVFAYVMPALGCVAGIRIADSVYGSYDKHPQNNGRNKTFKDKLSYYGHLVAGGIIGAYVGKVSAELLKTIKFTPHDEVSNEQNIIYSKDYYQMLNINQNASAEEISKAYRQLARQYHPDRNKSPEASERMKEINDAYGILNNPSTRKRYNLLRSFCGK